MVLNSRKTQPASLVGFVDMEKSKMNINKFNLGDTVHVSVKVVGVTLVEDKLYYTVQYTDMDGILQRMFDVPESFISKVF